MDNDRTEFIETTHHYQIKEGDLKELEAELSGLLGDLRHLKAVFLLHPDDFDSCWSRMQGIDKILTNVRNNYEPHTKEG